MAALARWFKAAQDTYAEIQSWPDPVVCMQRLLVDGDFDYLHKQEHKGCRCQRCRAARKARLEWRRAARIGYFTAMVQTSTSYSSYHYAVPMRVLSPD